MHLSVQVDIEVVGATFLRMQDRYALEVFPATGNITTENGNIGGVTPVLYDSIEHMALSAL